MPERIDPVVRVYTFGKFRVERLEPVLAGETSALHYVPISNSVWGKRNDGRKLLKLLVCSDYRRAPRDVLLEMLWPDAEKSRADRYLNSAASNLRHVLQTANGESLLRTVRPDKNVTLYELADQHDIWLDVDAFLDLFAQAEQVSQGGGDPLPLLEKAQQLACGEFLIEHLYHSWADQLRQSVNAARHRCVYQLATLYEQRGLYEQAEALLYSVLKKDLTDEDVLCRLMQVLARQGKPAEALACYERTKRALAKDLQSEPLASTQALVKRLRNETVLVEQATPSLALSPHIPSPQLPSSLNSFERVKYDILVPASAGIQTDSLDVANGDCAMWFSEQLAQIIAFVSRWQNQMPTRDFEKMLDRELRVFDEMKQMFDADEYFLSRRSALLVIATLPKGLVGLIQQHKVSFIEKDFLPVCAASITACWYLLNGREFASVERTLSRYLSFLIMWATQPSTYQQTSAYLAAQGCMLLSLVASHQMQFQQRIVYCRKAVEYAKIAGDIVLLVKALTMLGNAQYDNKCYHKMLQAYQEAHAIVAERRQKMPLVLQSKVLMGLAHAYAQYGQTVETLNAISEARGIFPEEIQDVPTYLSSDDGIFSLILFEGWVRLDLGTHHPVNGYYEQAAQSLSQIEHISGTLLVPERIRVEILNRRAQAAIALGDLEVFHAYTLAGVESLKTVKSEKRRQEIVTNYRAARKQWPNQSQLLELAEVLL